MAVLAIVVMGASSFATVGWRMLHPEQMPHIKTAYELRMEKMQFEGKNLRETEALLNSLKPGDQFSIIDVFHKKLECVAFENYVIGNDPYRIRPFLVITALNSHGLLEELYYSPESVDHIPLEIITANCGRTAFPPTNRSEGSSFSPPSWTRTKDRGGISSVL